MKIDLFSIPSLTLPVTVTATASASVALPATGNSLRVVNEGPNVAFISVGTGAQTATLPNTTPTITSVPCVVGETIFNIPAATVLQISAICRAAGTALLDVQVGEGT